MDRPVPVSIAVNVCPALDLTGWRAVLVEDVEQLVGILGRQ
jgi:hypothetical protein